MNVSNTYKLQLKREKEKQTNASSLASENGGVQKSQVIDCRDINILFYNDATHTFQNQWPNFNCEKKNAMNQMVFKLYSKLVILKLHF